MDDQQTRFWHEVGQFFGKAMIWLAYISIGVIAKLAFDSRNNNLSRRMIIIKSILSIFCGYIAAVICENYGYVSWGKIIVPVSTLLGEGIVVYFMSNWKSLANKFFTAFFPASKKGTDIKED